MPKFATVSLCERSYPVRCLPLEGEDLRVNDFCVVSQPDGEEEVGFVKGYEYGCAGCGDQEGEEESISDLPRILRRAVSREVRAWHFLKRRTAEALAICREKAAEHHLDMKVSSVKFDDRQRRILFNFTADKRVDFRELVKDLTSSFRARIELWQIGVRDEAKRMGGFGICGSKVCCASWMRQFIPVSIRCVKSQDIPFSPTKLSGVCGRLRCCLAYEHEQYAEMGKNVPRIGAKIQAGELGEAKVVDRNLLTGVVTIADSEGKTHTFPVSSLRRLSDPEKKQGGWEIVPQEEEAPSLVVGDESSQVTPRRSRVLGDASPPAAPRREPSRRPSAPGRRTESSRRAARRPGRTDTRSDSASESSQGDSTRKPRRRRRGRRGGKSPSSPSSLSSPASASQPARDSKSRGKGSVTFGSGDSRSRSPSSRAASRPKRSSD